MNETIHIGELASPCLTRQRGKEAYIRLADRLRSGSVDLVLDGAGMLSLSYLDGLINDLISANHTDHVTFIASDEKSLNKLSRIAKIRAVRLFYRPSTEINRKEIPIRHNE
jgi:hypothetical protein